MALRTSPPAVRYSRPVVRRPVCASAGASPAPHSDGCPSRRALLAGAPALLLASTLAPPALAFEGGGGMYTVETLPKPFRKAQRQAYQRLLTTTLAEECKALDYRKLVRLLFNDAAAGGRDGSVHFSEELGRPENKGLADTVKALASAKDKVDAASKTEDGLSWTDLVAYAAQVRTRQAFREELKKAIGQDKIVPGLGNDFPLPPLGGVDGAGPSPVGLIPAADAPLDEWKATFARMGLRNTDLAVIGPDVIGDDPAKVEARLAEDPEMAPLMARFAASKAVVSRTSYEVQYAKSFLALCSFGLKENTGAYLYAEERPVVRL